MTMEAPGQSCTPALNMSSSLRDNFLWLMDNSSPAAAGRARGRFGMVGLGLGGEERRGGGGSEERESLIKITRNSCSN